MVLLTFDIEEFDVPLEYGMNITLEDQIEISKCGTSIILDLLKTMDVKATFFCTVTFAKSASEIINRIINEGHELASHGMSHATFHSNDLAISKNELEIMFEVNIKGFRMPRMGAVDINALQQAGYRYNSSINPTYIPGRYNALNKPRTIFIENDVIQIPTSVTPIFRFPLFWLSFHILPLKIYTWLTNITLWSDKYIHLYFHSWEFIELCDGYYNLPKYITKNTGKKMTIRLQKFIETKKKNKHNFIGISDFLSRTTTK